MNDSNHIHTCSSDSASSSGAGETKPRREDETQEEQLARIRFSAFKLALRSVRCPEVAQDLAQDALIRALQKCGLHEEHFEPYFFRVLSSLLVTHHRRSHRQVYLEDEHIEPISRQTPECVLGIVRLFDDFISRLSERNREAFLMVLMDDVPYEVVAEYTGRTIGSERVHFSRLLKRLEAEYWEAGYAQSR